MATKANYPYHGGMPKGRMGPAGPVVGPLPASAGRKANGATPKANQPEGPFVKRHK